MSAAPSFQLGPPTRGHGALGPDGALRTTTPGFDALVGPVHGHSLAKTPEAFWSSQGLLPLADGSGLFRRPGGPLLRVWSEPFGDGILLSVESIPGADVLLDFLSVASHDVRGPIATVRSYAALLASPRFSLDVKVKRAVEVMLRNADRALALFAGAMEAWRAEAGALVPELESAALAPILDDSVTQARAVAEGQKVRLEVEIPDALPVLRLDVDRIRESLNGVWAHVLARSRAGAAAGLNVRGHTGSGVELIFWDVGPSLSGEEEAVAFDWARQAVRAHELGTGFRLALAAAQFRAHGGDADVGSRNGRTLFRFTLPAAHIPEPE